MEEYKCETYCEKVHFWDKLYWDDIEIHTYLLQLLDVLFITKYDD